MSEAEKWAVGRTLKFKPEDSLNADTTENIYIEGDNLEALKLLRRNYYGKIKMIYIDPPYNTGNDFVYKDDFAMSEKELSEMSGATVNGERMQKNSKDSAKYHTNWLNMIYPRLRVAKDLLTDDGVIFISIDDNEVENLKKVCNEIFGSENFVAQINIITGANQSGEGVLIQKNVEYCLCYAKCCIDTVLCRVDKTEETYRNLNDAPTPLETRLDMGYSIYFNPQTKELIPVFDYDKNKVCLNSESQVYTDNKELLLKGFVPIRPGQRNGKLHRWRWGYDTFITRKNEIVVFENGGKLTPKFKQQGFNAPKNTQNFAGGATELKKLFGENTLFDYPKGLPYIRYFCSIGLESDDIILDFFSGSATTAHAVMKLNAEDGGNRKFIMVQLPEETDEKSEAFKAGYKNICEIGKERIRRASKKIHEEKPDAVFDDGFKVFTVDNTNIRWTHDAIIRKGVTDYDYTKGIKDDLDFMPGYKDIDVVYEIMLRQYGIPLSTPIEKLNEVSDRTYIFADSVVVCLDENITSEIVEKLASLDPTPGKFIFRDSAFEDDIELKDVTFRRLSALVQNHFTEDQRKKATTNYTVEFI